MIYNHLGQLPAFQKLRDSALRTLCGIVRWAYVYISFIKVKTLICFEFELAQHNSNECRLKNNNEIVNQMKRLYSGTRGTTPMISSFGEY